MSDNANIDLLIMSAIAIIAIIGFPVLGTKLDSKQQEADEYKERVEHVDDSLSSVIDSLEGEIQWRDSVISYADRHEIHPSLSQQIMSKARKYGVPLRIAYPLIDAESRFKADAVSVKGAVGLTQVLPSTARSYREGSILDSLYNPQTNLDIGFNYLRDLYNRYNSWQLALMAYHRGPTRLDNERRAGVDHGTSHDYSRRILR